jgi:anti-sigma B factor antagonist
MAHRREGKEGRAERSEPPERSHLQSAEQIPDFGVAVRPDGPDVWVDAEGELDVYTSPRLKDAITQALSQRPPNVYVDLSRVTFIDSSTISVLATAHRQAPLQGSALIIHAPSRPVRRTLTVAGLVDHLNIAD